MPQRSEDVNKIFINQIADNLFHKIYACVMRIENAKRIFSISMTIPLRAR
jgi:hypothetical protein